MMRTLALLVLCFCYALADPDLIIKNSCSFGLWAEARQVGNALIPGESAAIKYVAPGSSVSYTMPAAGLSSTRFWAKYGCNNQGANCIIGDQVANTAIYPNGGCPSGGCHPPVDSLFEATWGCKTGSGCSTTTWFDTSQVDGWTLPYRVLLSGNTQCDCTGSGCVNLKMIDSSKLDLAQCPTGEDLSNNGAFSQYKNQDLRIIKNGKTVACKSPCKHMNLPSVQTGLGLSEGSNPTEYYCCPTPNPSNCQPSAGCLTPDACRAGPIPNTQYVKRVHSMTNNQVYAFSYDDAAGLHTCPASGVTYTMEYCPPGSASYPPGGSSSSATSATGASTQPPSSSSSGSGSGCGSYDANSYVCTNGHLCPKSAPNWCNDGSCFSTASYKCCSGKLSPTNAC